MSEKPNTKIYGLVGYPLKHSLSYIMHDAVFKKLGLPCAYENFEIKPENFDKDIAAIFLNKDIKGFNITIPYKEIIKRFARDGEWFNAAQAVGAANVVKIEDGGGRIFDNTDFYGFKESLEKKFGYKPRGKKVVLLGAGGAAKAIFAVLDNIFRHDMGEIKGEIVVYDIISKKAKDLIGYIYRTDRPQYPCKVVDDARHLGVDEADILINATPVGMKEGDPLLIEKNSLHEGLFVYDIVYNRETELIKAAKEKGLEAHNGLWMLILQGYRSLEIWLGDVITKNKDVVLKTMEDALKDKGFIAC